MGLSDIKDVTTKATQNWKSRCECEERARDAWYGKFGWILDEYKELGNQLSDLRGKRPYVTKEAKTKDNRSVKPFAVTTCNDIGWLSARPEFQLEILGPYPNTGAARPPIYEIPKNSPSQRSSIP